MKAAARILATATTLAALTALSLAAGAYAAPPQHDPPGVQRQQATTDDAVGLFRSGERASLQPATPPNSGHGAQFDPADPAPSQPSSDPANSAPASRGLVPVVAVTLLGLLLALAGATWFRRRHRPREAV